MTANNRNKYSIRVACAFWLIFCSGCKSPESIGAEKWPFIPYVTPVEEMQLTPAQRDGIAQLMQTNADAYKIVHGRLEAYKSAQRQYSAGVQAYMQRAIEVNRTQLTDLLHYSKDEANVLIRSELAAKGYPEPAIKGFGL